MGQVAWLCQQQFAHFAFGELELLLYGVEKVVVELDKDYVKWVSLQEILDFFKFSFEQFVDCCLLAGYGRCRSFEGIQSPGSFYFNGMIDAFND